MTCKNRQSATTSGLHHGDVYYGSAVAEQSDCDHGSEEDKEQLDEDEEDEVIPEHES